MTRTFFYSLIVVALGWLSGPVVAKASASDSPTPYLQATLGFLDTVIDEGTDRYGDEHSPMFCSILDLNTQRMPEEAPPLLPGQRAADRAFPGGNMQQDMVTLLTMYHVSELTGRDRYREAADAYLEFFLRRCAPVDNGLFPCGEHAFWNFLKEDINRGRVIHESLAFVPREFLDKLRRINPEATAQHIRALQRHISDPEKWYWNRHAPILRHI